MGISSFIFFLCFFVFAFLLSKIILSTASKNKSSSTMKLPPGPRKLPLIGHLHLFLLRSSDPARRILRDLALEYGPLLYLQLGNVPTIVVTSREIAKEIFKTQDVNFANRPSLLIGEVMLYNNTDLAFAPYSDYWRQSRKILTQELLSMKRVQSFQPVREEEFLNLCRWIASNEGSPIDLTDRLFMTMYDIITRISIGKKTGLHADFIPVMKQLTDASMGFQIVDYYPSNWFLRKFGGIRNAQRLHHKLDEILEKILTDRQANNNAEKMHEDFLDVLLKFHGNAAGAEYTSLTSNNIKAMLSTIFNGATDTSSVTLDWAMAELLKQPKLMRKAQDEVRTFYDKRGYVDESITNELTYIKLIIKETLRLHTPGSLLLPRVNKEACMIAGYHIPANTQLFVNAWAMGRDPNYWKDAEKFIPERFLDSSLDFRGNNYEYLPFGSGKRICPGITFGIANIEFPLAMLLYHFDWVLANGVTPEEMDMTEHNGAVSTRAQHLDVIPVLKRPLPSK